MRRRRRACCVITVVGALGGGVMLSLRPALADGPATVLAHNDPALARDMLDRYTWFTEWLFDVQLTPAERTKLEQFVVRHWTLNHTDEMRTVVQVLETERQLKQQYPTPAEQAVVREEMFPPVLAQSRELARTDLETRWLLEIYDRQHAPLAAGDPPLTARVLEARVEMLAFLLSESGVLPIDVDEPMKRQVREAIVAGYAKLDDTARTQIGDAPRQWAAIQYVWQQASDAEKQKYRADWSAAATAGMTESQRQVLAAMRQVRAVMASLPARAARPQVVRVADQLDKIAQTITITTDSQAKALADGIRATAVSLRAASEPPAGDEAWLRDEMTDEEWAAYQTMSADARKSFGYEIVLRRTQRQHRASMWMHCHSMNQIMWTTGSAYRYELQD